METAFLLAVPTNEDVCARTRKSIRKADSSKCACVFGTSFRGKGLGGAIRGSKKRDAERVTLKCSAAPDLKKRICCFSLTFINLVSEEVNWGRQSWFIAVSVSHNFFLPFYRRTNQLIKLEWLLCEDHLRHVTRINVASCSCFINEVGSQLEKGDEQQLALRIATLSLNFQHLSHGSQKALNINVPFWGT